MRIDRQAISTGETLRIAPIAPSTRSVIGSGEVAKAQPTPEVLDRRVVARNPPPPAEPPFSQRENLLRKQPGRTLEPAVVETEQDSTSKRRKNIRVLGEQKDAVDVRASGSGPAGDSAQPQPLDRLVEPKRRPEPGKTTHDRQAVQQRQEQQQQRKADSDRQAAQQQEQKQQQEQQRRKADSNRPVDQQPEQQQEQRKADSDRQAAQQQAQEQAQEQQQRKADSDRPMDQQQEPLERKANSAQQKGQVRQPPTSGPAGRSKNVKQPLSERRLECEREARRLHQDASQCGDLQ
jgi:hypothetical protein